MVSFEPCSKDSHPDWKWNAECAFKEEREHLKCSFEQVRVVEIESKRSPVWERRFKNTQRDGPGEEDFDEKSGEAR